MKSITALSEQEYAMYAKMYNNLRELTVNMTNNDKFSMFKRKSGYAHYTFSGKVSDKLKKALSRMPTPDEIIMLVDDGFSHFGATCSLGADGTFSGKVNTD